MKKITLVRASSRIVLSRNSPLVVEIEIEGLPGRSSTWPAPVEFLARRTLEAFAPNPRAKRCSATSIVTGAIGNAPFETCAFCAIGFDDFYRTGIIHSAARNICVT